MTRESAATPGQSAAPAARKRGGGPSRIVRSMLASILTLMLVLVLAAVALWVGVRSESGTRAIWKASTWLSQGHLSGDLVGGTLADGMRLKNVIYSDATQRFAIDKIDGGWQLSRSPLKFSITHLHAGMIEARMQAKPSEPTILPTRLTLPLAFSLNGITLDKLSLQQGLSTIELRNLSLRAESDRIQHTLVLERLDTAFGTANAIVHLNGEAPFTISGGAELSGAYEQEKYQIDASVSGTLSALNVIVHGRGDKLNASANIAATPFASIPFQRAQLNAKHINPKLFNAGAPLADLNLQADLVPVSAPLAVSGPLHITNAMPGALDKDRLPLISADAELRLDGNTQQLSGLQIKLVEKASISGGGTYHSGGQQKNTGAFQFDVAGLDLHALHGQLQASQLRGPVSVRLNGNTQEISLNLADKHLSAKVEASIDPGNIKLSVAQLAAGPAHLDASGSLVRGGEMAYAVKGKLRDFDPGLWIKGSASKPVAASINMDFDAAGKLTPELQLKLKFGILDSMYASLPMTGSGTVNLIGKRLLPSDARLSVAGNNAQLNGSFGARGDRLHVTVDAAHLQGLGFGLAGALHLDGEVSGSLRRPAVRASYRAEKLLFGAHRLDSLSGQADIQTDLDAKVSAAANHLQLGIEAHGYRGPDIVLNKLSANLSGTFGNHSLKLESDGSVREKPLALTLAAQGKLFENATGYGWQGSLSEFRNQGIPRISLDAPLAISASADKLVLGATRLNIANAVVDLKNFSFDQGRIRSAGAIDALNVNTVLDLMHEFTGKQLSLTSDLVLDSSWDFGLAESASGFFDVKRRSGDVRVNPGRGETALGLSELRLRANFQGTQARLDSALAAARIGSASGQLQLGLIRLGNSLTITDSSSLSGTVKADVPQLKIVGALIGPQVGLDGSLALDLRLAGTLGQPKLSGAVAGDKLAVTLYDQGIKLRDGIARITLAENVIDLQQLEFHGGDGSLRATGRLQLGKSNPDLSATVVAERLQLFASPDRQLMLSGQARVANVNQQLHVDGKFTVDKALFDLPKNSAPTLGDDVVIVRNDAKTQAPALTEKEKIAKTAEKPAGSMTPIMDIEVGFGSDFRFRGSGADLRLGGTMLVHSEPFLPLRATGTIRVTDGTYEVFGRKLAIERGLINFRGPIDNPNINILAMRRNQDVEAGAEISGYASAPRVKLVSEPNVSDEEKLSWLMFGHGSESSALGQRQATGQALALLGNYGGKKIAQGIGLDEFSIGSSDSGLVDEQVVNLGKAITERINLGYEQSLSGAANILKLTWQFSRRWSMVLRGGTINGLDVLYNRRFDDFWVDRVRKMPDEKKESDAE